MEKSYLYHDDSHKVSRCRHHDCCTMFYEQCKGCKTCETRYPKTMMVFGCISSERNFMSPPHIFEQGLWLNSNSSVKLLKIVAKPWPERIATGRLKVWQQDLAPITLERVRSGCQRISMTSPAHFWPLISCNFNPMNHYVHGLVRERHQPLCLQS